MLNLISQAMDMKKEILLTYIMLAARVTTQYCSMIVAGMLVVCTFTRISFHCTVLPLSEPRSGPKMCSVVSISHLVMRQLGKRL